MTGWEAASHESSGFCFCGETHSVEPADRPDWVLESRYKVDTGVVEHWYNDRDRQEVQRLRTIIENAPHREHCRPNIACICWKADAL